jgi:hypothetical protein
MIEILNAIVEDIPVFDLDTQSIQHLSQVNV